MVRRRVGAGRPRPRRALRAPRQRARARRARGLHGRPLRPARAPAAALRPDPRGACSTPGSAPLRPRRWRPTATRSTPPPRPPGSWSACGRWVARRASGSTRPPSCCGAIDEVDPAPRASSRSSRHSSPASSTARPSWPRRRSRASASPGTTAPATRSARPCARSRTPPATTRACPAGRRTLESSLIDIEDVSAELRDYADEVDFDPEELDRLQTRLAALEGLRRAYGPGMADVLRRRAEAREVVAAASDGGELERRAAEELRRREAALAEAADALDAVRAEAAPRLAAAVSEQMAFLEMGSAGLEVAQERLPRAEWDPPRALPRGVPLSPGCGPHGAPAAAHRVGRRGQPRDAGAQGGARRGGLLRDARLRRGRRRRGRRHGGRARERAGPTRPDAPGRRGHAPRAGGGWRPSGTTSSRSTRVRAACPRPCSRRSRARSGVAEVARMLSGDTGAASRDLAREMLAERARRAALALAVARGAPVEVEQLGDVEVVGPTRARAACGRWGSSGFPDATRPSRTSGRCRGRGRPGERRSPGSALAPCAGCAGGRRASSRAP